MLFTFFSNTVLISENPLNPVRIQKIVVVVVVLEKRQFFMEKRCFCDSIYKCIL